MKRRAFQVVDLGFGDGGKGTLVDYLAARHGSDLIVRFNGGPQAGHNVILPDGRHHTFAQFGSAMFLAGIRTLLSRFMLIEPYSMLNEAEHLAKVGVADALARTDVDGRCRVIVPPQQIANRLRERARGAGKHGTCGLGVGECVEDSILHPALILHAADLGNQSDVRRKLREILEFKRDSLGAILRYATTEERRVFDDPSWIDVATELYFNISNCVKILSPDQANQSIREAKCIVFEGAQGVLLDEHVGFAPHTTWSTTTFANADVLIDESESDAKCEQIGVMRCYMTRHGAGPLVTEDRGLDQILPESHNIDGGWAGRFRRGVLDLVMLRYAIKACGGVDALAVTCLDRLPQLPGRVCDGYEFQGKSLLSQGNVLALREQCDLLTQAQPQYRHWPTDRAETFVAALESALEGEVKYCSSGPTRLDKSESIIV